MASRARLPSAQAGYGGAANVAGANAALLVAMLLPLLWAWVLRMALRPCCGLCYGLGCCGWHCAHAAASDPGMAMALLPFCGLCYGLGCGVGPWVCALARANGVATSVVALAGADGAAVVLWPRPGRAHALRKLEGLACCR
jgi:hypothetical protein